MPRAVILLPVITAMVLIDSRSTAYGSTQSCDDAAQMVFRSVFAQQGRAPARKPGTTRTPNRPRVKAAPPAGVVIPESEPQPWRMGPVFDVNANALRDVTEALQRAKYDNRRVLIHWGSNDCETCSRLHAVMTNDGATRRVLEWEYELVLIDVGSRERNMDIALSYGVAPQTAGIPWLTMLDFNGKPIANMHAGQFGDGRGGFDADKLSKFLRGYQARYPAATAVLDAALDAARAVDKPLLVQFIAPTNSRCKEIEAWVSRNDVAAIVDRNFARVRIDLERTIGGRDLLRRYSGAWQTSPPWFILLNSRTGGLISTSLAGEGGANIAPLLDDASIHAFAALLQRNARIITPQEAAWLVKSLKEMNVPPTPRTAAEAAPTAPNAPQYSTAPTGD